jgi:hypothetical protein
VDISTQPHDSADGRDDACNTVRERRYGRMEDSKNPFVSRVRTYKLQYLPLAPASFCFCEVS